MEGVGDAGPAGDEAYADAAGSIGPGIGHEGRSAFLPAGDEAHRVAALIDGIERLQIAFARNAEYRVGTVGEKRIDQDLTAGSCRHLCLRGR